MNIRAVTGITLLLTLAAPADANLLINGGFETGDLSGWSVPVGNAVVIMQSSNGFIDPNTPRSGQWQISVSDPDVANGAQASYAQMVPLPASLGTASVTVVGHFAGATGPGGTSSDDLVQITLTFLDGGNNVGSVQSAALDPVVGSWNALALNDVAVPTGADTAELRVDTFLDPGFASIDILGDDFFLIFNGDSDGDGITDNNDNCVDYANPLQVDNDGDNIGNACDPDGAPAPSGDCQVNFGDLNGMKLVFFGPDPIYDLTGIAGDPDGTVNFADLDRMKQLFFANFRVRAENPSGVSNDCVN